MQRVPRSGNLARELARVSASLVRRRARSLPPQHVNSPKRLAARRSPVKRAMRAGTKMACCRAFFADISDAVTRNGRSAISPYVRRNPSSLGPSWVYACAGPCGLASHLCRAADNPSLPLTYGLSAPMASYGGRPARIGTPGLANLK